VFTNTPGPISSDEEYRMVREACNLAIEALDGQHVFAGAPVGTPSMCQLPSGPSLTPVPQTQQSVTGYSGFYCSIGGTMILIPTNIRS
jgi:hypothetical protein